ncbi:MAG: DUF167 family protein [Hyphomicrobium sp.]
MKEGADTPWKVGKGGLTVRVRVTPKSSRDSIEGIEATAEGPALRARVRAVPAEGEANSAVQALLAEWLAVPKSRVMLVAGAKSRVKSFSVSGELPELEANLIRKSAAFTSSGR